MKVTKRLSDYVAVKVEAKLPITNTYAAERDICNLTSILSKEFAEKVNVLRDEFLKEAEEEHPQLKYLTRNSFDGLCLYTVHGSNFEKYNRELERKEHYKRKATNERIVLRLELADEGVSLDDIDLIIEAEIAKATTPDVEIVSAEEVTDEIN